MIKPAEMLSILNVDEYQLRLYRSDLTVMMYIVYRVIGSKESDRLLKDPMMTPFNNIYIHYQASVYEAKVPMTLIHITDELAAEVQRPGEFNFNPSMEK